MKRLALVITLFSTLILCSQTIKGNVKDALGNIAFADIIVKDNSGKIVTGTTSNDNGIFSVEVSKGTYRVLVSFMGYKNWEKDITIVENLDLGTIILVEDAEKLEEVIIKSKKRVIQQKVDRLVFNVEKSIVAEGGNGTDILKVAPRVRMQNGVLEILGKGASRLLINGRLSPLTGEELTAFLETLNASEIKEIEVITNPPAKYEAAGQGGLINIILKKSKLNSWSNTSRLVYNQNKFNFTTFQNSFNYNKNKLSLITSVSATKGKLHNDENLQVFYPVNFWNIDIDYEDKKDNYSGRFQLDYEASEKVDLGFQYLGSLSQPGGFGSVTSHIFNPDNELESIIKNEGENKVSRYNHALNFHSEVKLDTLGRTISIDADYFQYNSDDDRDFITESFNNTGESLGITSGGLSMTDQNIENFSSRIDVTYPIQKVQFAFGAKASMTTIESNIQFFNTISGEPVLDTNRSNDFMYEENNIAAYVSGSTNVSNKLQIKLGLRVESTNTLGVSVQTNESNSNSFTKLFPTAYISYNKNENNSFNLSYGRRINRPRFSDLNPFKIFINDNSFSEGNPFLKPAFTDSFEFSHSYKRNLNSSLFFSVTNNGFGVIFTSDPGVENQIVTRDNYITHYRYGISENYSFSPLSWWQNQSSVSVIGYYSKFEKEIAADPRNGAEFRVSSNNTFSLSENSKLVMNSWYSSAYSGGLFSLGEMFDMSLGFQHTFKKSNLKLSVFANDIFKTSGVNNLTSVVNGVKQVYAQNYSTRNLAVSLSYNFGNKKLKVKDRTFGNDEERRRSN